MRSRWIAIALGIALFAGVALYASQREEPEEPSAAPKSSPQPVVPVPQPVEAPPGNVAEFQAEWSTVRESVLAGAPDAMADLRALVERWRALEPVPDGLLEARSLTHLMEVEDAARALEAR
jgi:hypothetical protein